MLDRKKYVVLSDFSKCENGESSVLQESENLIELQHDDLVQGDSNDILVGGDEEMVYPDSESYDEDLFPVVNDTEHVDVGEVLIGLKGFRCRFKDLPPPHGIYLEDRLSKYCKVLGPDLSRRIVFMLN